MGGITRQKAESGAGSDEAGARIAWLERLGVGVRPAEEFFRGFRRCGRDLERYLRLHRH